MASFDKSTFRRVLGHYPTGVCMVTTMTAEGDPVGMVIGSFTSVSLEPPLVAFLPAKTSMSWARIHATGKFCVNVLASDQQALCRKFVAANDDKFAGVSHALSENGCPVLDDAIAWIDCTLAAVHEAGDHFIVVGKVNSLKAEAEGQPLLFYRGGYGGFAAAVPSDMSS